MHGRRLNLISRSSQTIKDEEALGSGRINVEILSDINTFINMKHAFMHNL